MFRIEVHQNIQRLIQVYYRVGLLHKENGRYKSGKAILEWFYLIYFSLFPISLAVGAFLTDNTKEKIFLLQTSVICFVLLMKLWYIIRKQNELLELLNRVCDYAIDDQKTFASVNYKITFLMKFVTVFLIGNVILLSCEAMLVPFYGFVTNERRLFFRIGFPLDWKSDELSYWVAFIFCLTSLTITSFSMAFNVIVWYLMANCSWRYEVPGQQLKRIGEITVAENKRSSNVQRDDLYLRDLLKAVTSRNDLEKMTSRLGLFLSNFFAVETTTSALSICGATYSIALVHEDNIFELLIYVTALLYHIFDILMLMYFGNVVKSKSDILSYRLYESNWIDRSLSIKKIVLILGTFLIIPHQLIVFKIYPLTLETFTNIMNAAYVLLNVLKKL